MPSLQYLQLSSFLCHYSCKQLGCIYYTSLLLICRYGSCFNHCGIFYIMHLIKNYIYCYGHANIIGFLYNPMPLYTFERLFWPRVELCRKAYA